MIMYEQGKRFEVYMGLDNPYNHEAFNAECRNRGLAEMPLSEFLHKSALIQHGMFKYPDLHPLQAMVETNNAINNYHASLSKQIEQPPCADSQKEIEEISKGVGDTIAKFTHAVGLDVLTQKYTEITGKPCGCEARRQFLNKLLPYKVDNNGNN